MSTSAQQQANRRNAEQSTGPKTDAGKAHSSQNARRHGLCSFDFVLRREEREEFDALLADLHEEHRPSCPTEALLVQQMAQHFWLSQRAMRLQGVALEFTEHHLVPKDLAVLIRYQTTNERAFQKDLATLLALQKQRAKQEIGSVPQPAKPAPAPVPGPVSTVSFQQPRQQFVPQNTQVFSTTEGISQQ